MKVKDVMRQPAISCSADTNIGAAVEILWKHNFGLLPIAGRDGKLQGVVTDRDICIATGTRNRLPGEIAVGEIASKPAVTCQAEDEIHEALLTMAEKQVRRLPVVNGEGALVGVLSMDDIITHGDLKKWEGCCELSSEEIIRALKKLYGKKNASRHAKAVAAG